MFVRRRPLLEDEARAEAVAADDELDAGADAREHQRLSFFAFVMQ